MDIQGALGAGIVDCATGAPLATAGASPGDDPGAAAAGAADVVRSVVSGSPFVSAVPHDVLEDVIVTTAAGYHLFRPLTTEFDSRLVLHVWLDRATGNLAVARHKLHVLADELVTV